MDFKYINIGDYLFKNKNFLRSRDISTLEFQVRVMDLIFIKDTPFIERLNFIKIVDSNLREFIAVRLPDLRDEERHVAIHTIEEIYNNLGYAMDVINEKYEGKEIPDESLSDIVMNKDFRYIYAGESELEVAGEITEVLKIKGKSTAHSTLYSEDDITGVDDTAESIIRVPKSVLLINYFIKYYKEKYKGKEGAKFPNNKLEVIPRNYYEFLRIQDVLIRNPYDSYEAVLDFIDQMCTHPNITTIMITLYRTAHDSQIVQSLLKARKMNKMVCVYIEPTARDNEEGNLKNILALQKAGAFVHCNYFNYKVHAKAFCAVSKDFTVYTHVGTGNYNEATSKMYTDTHLLTCNEDICAEVLQILLGLFSRKVYHPKSINIPIFTSPLNFREKINQMIDIETAKGDKGLICIKCNNVCDGGIIDRLYRAVSRGVKVCVISRTGCSIDPSSGIEIRSKVGQYLEHDRFYIFGSRVFISSADLLLRNISKRVELLCEIPEIEERDKVISTFWNLWNDKNIHRLTTEGTWEV